MVEESFRSMAWQQEINAPVREVFRAWTLAIMLRDWLCDDVDVDPRPGGRFYAWWRGGYYAGGQFIEIDPERSLLLAWKGRDSPSGTRVRVKLREKNKGTLVEVEHLDVPNEKSWDSTAEAIRLEWESALENLSILFETGFPARMIRRPRIGIGAEDILEGQNGILVNQIQAGSGAERAGLREKDILTEIDTRPVYKLQDLTDILSQHHTGDKVKVSFIRSGEHQSVDIILLKTEAPTLPESARELADAGREMSERLQSDLEKLVKGKSEAQCEARLEGGWTVKEHLAQLILAERDAQTWLASLMINAPVPDAPENSAAVPTRLEALINVYPTVADLLNELKHTQAELLTFLGLLPDEFVQRKSIFRRIATWVLNNQDNYRKHLKQIELCLSNK